MIKLDDAGKLRLLADWLDLKDKEISNDRSDEVQQDLRRIADYLETKTPIGMRQ